MSRIFPALFVTHGAPTFILRPGAAGAALTAAASGLPKPRGIVVVSAHWDTPVPRVGFASQPETIHDFWGFPEALYAMRYEAPGSQDIAREVAEALLAAGLPVEGDDRRGLDHGAWVPLRLMFPDADIPVVPVSIQAHASPEHHYALGRALAPLAAKGLLILASGSITHNLRDYQTVAMGDGRTPAYVRQFSDWLSDKLAANDLPALFDYRRQAPEAVRAHPTDEHLLPLFVALGAGGDLPVVERLYAGVDDYVLAMDAYAFRPPSQ